MNAVLAAAKLVAGVAGASSALIADAVESSADVVGSFVVWGGLRVAAIPADEEHPYGHGKAEALAGAAVALLLVGASVGIAVQAVHEIRQPQTVPAAWTLAVLLVVMIVKVILARRVRGVGDLIGSTAVRADAWHHFSDAITSAAAFTGISIALWGRSRYGDARWAAADDWAALIAALVIGYNGVALLKPALDDLMDRIAGPDVVGPVRRVAESVDGVLAIEKLTARKVGLGYRVEVHVHAEPATPLDEAHALGGRVSRAIHTAVPSISSVLVHMEPFDIESEQGATVTSGAPGTPVTIGRAHH